MKLSFKKALLISAISAMITTSVFAADNPLSAMTQKSSIKFLERASVYATKKMSYSTENPKLTYNTCMTNGFKDKDTTFCTKFYDFMAEYANKSKKTSGVTAKNVQDKTFFESIQAAYVKDAENKKAVSKNK